MQLQSAGWRGSPRLRGSVASGFTPRRHLAGTPSGGGLRTDGALSGGFGAGAARARDITVDARKIAIVNGGER